MTADRPAQSVGPAALLIGVAVLVGVGWWWLAHSTRDALVVYCAHDLLYAEELLRGFERQSGVQVVIVGDTEATKSLGLVQRLLREVDAPQCDVFWNNEVLGTIELARQGVLEPYKGAGWNVMPRRFRDADGLWTGFGGRLRVWIENVDAQWSPPGRSPLYRRGDFPALSTIEPGQEDIPFGGSSLAIAQPMFGTTLTQYTVQWNEFGPEQMQRWQRGLVAGDARFVPGNATVKDLVAEGVCKIGMTDTDDAFLALDAGAPVEMHPIRVNGRTICIPNSVAIIRGTDRRADAERLVDFLTSPDSELRMARSRARQIPLGSVDPARIPEEVRPLAEWAQESVDLGGLADARADCLAWLTREFAP